MDSISVRTIFWG
uniref:Uncharacterized protein n=1 Tax=Rhizophora mucronata TaxID=61149 RepID=A0A2P2NAH4_RHIMU